MTESNPREEAFSFKDIPRGLYLGFGGLVLVIVVAIFFVNKFVETERARDMRSWQARLGIIADSRFAVIESWLDQQFSTLFELTENGSLQLYADRLQTEGKAGSQVAESADESYLHNLLEATAERSGFAGRVFGSEIDPKINPIGVGGLALLDTSGRLLVATDAMPPFTESLAKKIADLPKAERSLIDLHLGVGGKPTMGFALPVFSVQGEHQASDQIGLIVGIKEIAGELFPLLRQPGKTDKTTEGVLVRRTGNVIEYLSPLMDGTPALKLNRAGEPSDLASAFAIDSPGDFGLRTDYRNQEVLVISRKLAKAPWTFFYKIDKSEALAASDARLRTITIVGGLLIAIVVAVIIAVWRWGTSIRIQKTLIIVEEALERHKNLSKFLTVLSDNQQAEIYAVTREGKYTFANRMAAENAGMEAKDMLDKDIIGVLGPEKAKTYLRVNEEVLDTHEPLVRTYTFETADEGAKTYRVGHVPLRGDRDYPPGVLMVVDDITEFLFERDRHEASQRQLIRIMAMLVDQKDPHSMLHTTFVLETALGISRVLDLSDEDRQAIDVIAVTVNLGKVFVPADILLKLDDLTDDDRKTFEQGYLASNKLLNGINFDKSILEALDHVKEHWDGTGQPRGLKGDEITVTAQVVAVANAFVGMVSPRFHRDPIPFEGAVETITAEADKAYSSQVVMALIRYLENHGGRELLERLTAIKGQDVESQVDMFSSLVAKSRSEDLPV